jgi:YD repeat-containing protein
VELLPFTYSPPAWDGSYPYLVISPTDSGSGTVKLKSGIRWYRPTVYHESPINEFQVDLHTGMFVLRQTDLFISDSMPLSLTRTYRGWDFDKRVNEFGAATNHPYDVCPTGTRFPYTYMDLNLEDGRQIHFRRVSKGTGFADAVFRHEQTSSEFYGAQIAWNGNGWTLSFHDGRQFLFPDAYHGKNFAQGAPYEMQAIGRRRILLKRDEKRNLQQLMSPSGYTITLKYDGSDRIIEARDYEGHVRKYSYDANGYLETAADESHLLYRFRYTLCHFVGYDWYLMTAIVDGKGTVLLQNIYKDSDGGSVSEQRLANGEVYRYQYTSVRNAVTQTIVEGPGGKRTFHFQPIGS